MSFTTVGELMEALKSLPPSMPILKSVGSLYQDIYLHERLTYRVCEDCTWSGVTGETFYKDCPHNNPEGFDAIVL